MMRSIIHFRNTECLPQAVCELAQRPTSWGSESRSSSSALVLTCGRERPVLRWPLGHAAQLLGLLRGVQPPVTGALAERPSAHQSPSLGLRLRKDSMCSAPPLTLTFREPPPTPAGGEPRRVGPRQLGEREAVEQLEAGCVLKAPRAAPGQLAGTQQPEAHL